MMKQQMIDNSAKIVSPDTVTTSTRYCHKFAEFMKTRPPTFAGSATSWYTDQWLGTIENRLDMVQCDEKNKVFYAAHQLQGAALECWKGYCATDKDPQAIGWAEFSSILHYMDVSPGFIKTKDHTKDGEAASYKAKCMSKTRKASSKTKNVVCFSCNEMGHFANRCPLRHQTPAQDKTIPKAILTKRITPTTGGEALPCQENRWRGRGGFLPASAVNGGRSRNASKRENVAESFAHLMVVVSWTEVAGIDGDGGTSGGEPRLGDDDDAWSDPAAVENGGATATASSSLRSAKKGCFMNEDLRRNSPGSEESTKKVGGRTWRG
uniref:CCHC-type domain-containing protein n=1 Tax=Oryza nivara TaxID=4536 RepID=A0A0E0IH15_ORYNI